MKAIRFYEFGPPEVLRLEAIPVPKPQKNEVLVQIYASGLNPIDYKIRNGSSFISKTLKNHLPSGLGYDFAGKVMMVGSHITELKPGDCLLGWGGFPNHPSCYAQYVCVSPKDCAPKPPTVSFAQAAALPTAAVTALQALNAASIQPGDSVLIHAGAGGVGHLAIQLAKSRKARVITTASEANHAFLKKIGADQCIDYRKDNFVTAISHSVDVVIDLIGGEVGVTSLNCLSEKGKLVTVPTITAEAIIAAGKKKNRVAMGLLKTNNTQDLAYLVNQVAQGHLHIEIEKIFHLEEAILAHTLLEKGHVRGKLVFEI